MRELDDRREACAARMRRCVEVARSGLADERLAVQRTRVHRPVP
jgi:hypothetical protein